MPLLETSWLLSGRRTHLLLFSPIDEVVLYSHGLHAFYHDMHQEAREYKQEMRNVNELSTIKGKQPYRRCAFEMDNFQDPQAS